MPMAVTEDEASRLRARLPRKMCSDSALRWLSLGYFSVESVQFTRQDVEVRRVKTYSVVALRKVSVFQDQEQLLPILPLETIASPLYPLSTVDLEERQAARIPDCAQFYAFCLPFGIDWKSLEHPGENMSPDLKFLRTGGFIYFDTNENVCGMICLMEDYQALFDRTTSAIAEQAPGDAESHVCPEGVQGESEDTCRVAGIQSRASLHADVEALNAWRIPIQAMVHGIECRHIGWGPSPPYNLALRAAIGKSGAPFGGMGFFDPQSVDLEKCKAEQQATLQGALNLQLTSSDVRTLKLGQFRAQASGEDSAYQWAWQPMYNTKDEVVGAEVLLRVKNGSDSAPFEDVLELCHPEAPEDTKVIYAEWKVAELKHVLETVKEHKKLQTLLVSVNLRPADLNPAGLIYNDLVVYLSKLSCSDKVLMVNAVAIEVTEDQRHPDEFAAHLKAWKALGFSLHFDDAIGDLAFQAIKKGDSVNFHTTSVLTPLLGHIDVVKVDIEWAGYCIFLCHPAFNSKEKKDEVLRLAMELDQVSLPGRALPNTSHRKLVKEFGMWALEMIEMGKSICVECTVRADDSNCVYVLDLLKSMEPPLDIFGKHQEYFKFQGGPTRAKAFTPDVLAEHLRVRC